MSSASRSLPDSRGASRERDRLEALLRLSEASDEAQRLAALALSLATFPQMAGSAMLFSDDGETRTVAHGTYGFALRDDSAELRRLFLHAIAPFALQRTFFVPKDRTRALAGVSSVHADSAVLFVPLQHGDETLGMFTLNVEHQPDEERVAHICTFADVVGAMIAAGREGDITRHRLRQGRILELVTKRLHATNERQEPLKAVGRAVKEAFDAGSVTIHSSGAAERGADTAKMRSEELRRAFSGIPCRAHGHTFLPLTEGGKVTAVLELGFEDAHVEGDIDPAALRGAALQASTALINVRAHERQRQRILRAESLEKIVRILRDTQYVDEVLMVFVVTASHELRVDCHVYACEGNALLRRATRTPHLEREMPIERLDREPLEPSLQAQGVSDAALLTRKSRDAIFGSDPGVVVPLNIDGKVWGLLTIGGGELNTLWSGEDRDAFVRGLALHLEIALTNALAFEREARRAQERECLAGAARSMLAYAQVGPLVSGMCCTATDLVGADCAVAMRWNGERYERLGEFERIPDALSNLAFPLDSHLAFEASRTDERRQLRIIEGSGFAAIPLCVAETSENGETETLLVIGHAKERRFNRDDLRILHELGALLTLALRNSDLIEQTQGANRALHESNSFKDDLLAMLAHDFKAPLTVILGYCELLLETPRTDREELEMIAGQARRLVRLSDDALVLARSQAEGFSLARTMVDLREFVADAAGDFGADGDRLKLELGDEPVFVEIDLERFRHVLNNLFSNALKYSKEQVRVEVSRVDGYASLAVRDRGIGIPSAEVATLFGRFRRASNARRGSVDGSGIGLYVSRKIVDVHGGSIAVESVENEGSSFTVALPLATTPSPAPTAS